MYEVKYDLTRTLKIDFAVSNKATIDEPAGNLSKSEPNYKEKRDTIWQNFWDFGRATMYHQTLNINYQVPINKIPFLDFMSLNTRYSANYDWTSAPKSLQSLGNNIQNSNTRQYNGQINMNTLYNKVPYFRKINKSLILNIAKARLDEIFEMIKKQIIGTGLSSNFGTNFFIVEGGSNLFNLEKYC